MDTIPNCEAQKLLHCLARAVNIHVSELPNNLCTRASLLPRQISDEEMMKVSIEPLPSLLHRHRRTVILVPFSAILRPALDSVRTSDVVPCESRPICRAQVLEDVW